jgi:hypothetical protein
MTWPAAMPRAAWSCLAQTTICTAIASALVSAPARSETLLALAGVTDASNDPVNTYGWQLEFQEPISSQLGASLAWLNEGHTLGHHRDGLATQLWLGMPAWRNRMQFNFGVGPYFYFDTQQESSARGYSDVHSVAGIASASLSLNITHSWFMNLRVNGIYAPGDVSSIGFLVGGGYHFSRSERALSSSGSDGSPQFARQQIQLFAGEMIYNELNSHQDRTLGLEYRLALVPWAAWSATWFHNIGSTSSQREQIASQLWLVDSVLEGRLALSAGVGIYTPLGAQPAGEEKSAALSGLSGLRLEWCWSRNSSVMLTWYRSFTNDDDDRDIITLGYGFRFGG